MPKGENGPMFEEEQEVQHKWNEMSKGQSSW